MGTNYYFRSNICPHCGRYDEKHIGKLSDSWLFLFRSHPNIRSYQEWLVEFKKGGEIHSEYGKQITLSEFKEIVKKSAIAIHKPNQTLSSSRWTDREGYYFTYGEFT